jgi:hypothetical protein
MLVEFQLPAIELRASRLSNLTFEVTKVTTDVLDSHGYWNLLAL